MSILDNDSFDEYFDSSPSSPHVSAECAAAKSRYDSCFFKSYSERTVPPFACLLLVCESHMLGVERDGRNELALILFPLGYRVGEVRMDECKSLFDQYKNCLDV